MVRHLAVVVLAALIVLPARAEPERTLTGQAAFGDWRSDAPGVRRHITAADLPAPFASKSATNFSSIVSRPDGATPKAPPGFVVSLFADGLKRPRTLRVAPNGDVFVAETTTGKIKILRAADGAATAAQIETFISGLDAPFGIAFYPAGPDPQFVYIANMDSVIRYPYRAGDLKPRGPSQTIVKDIPTGGHSTRDIAFSPDGKHLYIAVGSETNVADNMARKSLEEARAFETQHGLGASWGDEERRADVLVTDPDGASGLHPFANGIRNCAGVAIQPGSGDLWCVTNERDALGDNLPPDYATRVAAGGFYGWPWYYIGAHEDPRRKGERPDLATKVTVPDVLLQPHSAPLGVAFYDGSLFPPAYRGDAFVTLHGSWNRDIRTGYKVVRIILKEGKPTGEYEDFLTGMVENDQGVWARPVGVAVAHDGALLMSEDANGTVWRVSYAGAGGSR